MTIHLLNQAEKISSACLLIDASDLVIITCAALSSEHILALKASESRVVTLSHTQLTSGTHAVAPLFDVISDSEWVLYTTSLDTVISWG